MLAVSWFGNLVALAGPAGDDALVSLVRVPVFPDRLRRHADRLVYRRGRAPAVGRLWPAAHQGCGHALADRAACARFAHRLRRRSTRCSSRSASTTSTSCCATDRPATTAGSPAPPPCGRWRRPVLPRRRRQPSCCRELAMEPTWLPCSGPLSSPSRSWSMSSSTASISASASCLGPHAARQHRVTMMNAIAPFWDGNETWLVVIGARLFAAFPMVYAVFLPRSTFRCCCCCSG